MPKATPLPVVIDHEPPKVEYSLSERGKSLIPLLREFDAWGRQQIEIDATTYKDRKTQ